MNTSADAAAMATQARLSELIEALRSVGGPPSSDPAHWKRLRQALASTASSALDYGSALTKHLARTSVPVRSIPGRRVDLYADVVARHLEHARPAVVYRQSGTWMEMSYRELHEETARLATLWARSGLEPGTRIALVIAPGPALCAALLAAFRLGTTPIVFPPGVGRGYVERRLAATPPSVVAMDSGHWTTSDRDAFAAHAPVVAARAPTGVVADMGRSSHVYAPDDIAIEVHGGFAPEPEEAVGVEASALWTRLATDASVVLPVVPGTKVAAPGVEPSRHPLLPLTALFGGGTWVEASVDALAEEPIRLDMVGVSASCRDAVLEGRLLPRGWANWFKDPSEPYDWAAWRSFEATLASVTPNPMGRNLLFSSGLGGAALFSPPCNTVDLEVLPSPGLDWVLEEAAAPGQVTESPAGVLAVRDGGRPAEMTGRMILSDLGPNFLFSGSMLAGRNATALPTRELSAVVRTHPAVDDAVVLCGPSGERLNAVTTTLLIFVDPARDPDPVAPLLEEALKKTIRHEMGPAYLPDRVVAVPLTPRRIDGVVDREWCRFQLQTGGLLKMASSEVHRLTSLLRRWGAATAAAGCPAANESTPEEES